MKILTILVLLFSSACAEDEPIKNKLSKSFIANCDPNYSGAPLPGMGSCNSPAFKPSFTIEHENCDALQEAVLVQCPKKIHCFSQEVTSGSCPFIYN